MERASLWSCHTPAKGSDGGGACPLLPVTPPLRGSRKRPRFRRGGWWNPRRTSASPPPRNAEDGLSRLPREGGVTGGWSERPYGPVTLPRRGSDGGGACPLLPVTPPLRGSRKRPRFRRGGWWNPRRTSASPPPRNAEDGLSRLPREGGVTGGWNKRPYGPVTLPRRGSDGGGACPLLPVTPPLRGSRKRPRFRRGGW